MTNDGQQIDMERYYRAYIINATLRDGTTKRATLDNTRNGHSYRYNAAAMELLTSLVSSGYDVVDYKIEVV